MITDKKICYIYGAMPLTSKPMIPEEKDLIIAADKGYETLKKIGLEPAFAVGDFDSLEFVPTDTEIILHPVEKDDTDMSLAVNEGIKRGFDTFVIYGGMGGRPDHTYANIQLAADMAKKGIKVFFIGEGYTVTALYESEILFDKKAKGNISVFSVTDSSKGVYEQGLKYSLSDAVLTNTVPLGVSNEFMGTESRVSVKKGILLVMFEGEDISVVKD
ncbi:MAG: thiamine diphosphokinase [Ruminococcaceae bacterium]|nr:thiamine diphosphokinase [Oscillospiraceae bacterium]